jgi:SAM-dependent methyltransferase
MNPGYIYKDLSRLKSVLDVGTGHGTIIKSVVGPKRRVGVDAYPPAIRVARKRYPGIEFRCFDVRQLGRVFDANEFDGVVGFDIVEHLDKPEALKLIKACERLARVVVWWFVPIGDHKQEFDPRDEGNEELQRHRSLWKPKEFTQLGYDVWHYPDWHKRHDGLHSDKSTEAAFCRKTIGHKGGTLHACRRFR